MVGNAVGAAPAARRRKKLVGLALVAAAFISAMFLLISSEGERSVGDGRVEPAGKPSAVTAVEPAPGPADEPRGRQAPVGPGQKSLSRRAPPAAEIEEAARFPAPARPAGFIGPLKPPGLPRVVSGLVEQSLYAAFARHFDPDDPEARLLAQQLAAHFKRLFFFDVNFRRDILPGDGYAFVWEPSDEATDGLRILAAMLYCGRHDRFFEAYYFEEPQARFGRHYDACGVNVQKSLLDPPLADFDQVTALLNDRRPRHDGIDFKAPVGTPVRLPWDAVVEKVSLKIVRYNGRFVGVRYEKSGYEAFFLHLDRVASGVRPGRSLKAGSIIGYVGNTGRSYAPHLHYQIQRRRGRILNPYDVHGSERSSVPAKDMEAFKDLARGYSGLLPDLAPLVAADDKTAARPNVD